MTQPQQSSPSVPATVGLTGLEVAEAGTTPNGSNERHAGQMASDVAAAASAGAHDVLANVREQTGDVIGQTKEQLHGLVDQARSELQSQADQRGTQLASTLRSLSSQFTALSEGKPDDASSLAPYLHDATTRLSAVADRIEAGGPDQLLEDLRRFARRRPAAFLVGAGVAGFALGRLARAGQAAARDDGDGQSAPLPAIAGTDGHVMPERGPYASTGQHSSDAVAMAGLSPTTGRDVFSTQPLAAPPDLGSAAVSAAHGSRA